MNESAPLTTSQKISGDRTRTNVTKGLEQKVIAYLCERLPLWMTPNVLTGIGFVGSIIVFLGFWFGRSNPLLLLFGVLGFAIQWFGDSLDGRIAYYRGIPRKWFGFSLDMTMDWLSTILIGLGFYIYLPAQYEIYVFTFVTAYAWTMIIALLKYRITDKYEIDAGLLGPTELRLLLCVIIGIEALHPGVLKYVCLLLNVVLFTVNIFDFKKLLRLANERDAADRLKK